MAPLENYRQIITNIIHRHATYLAKSKTEIVTICDSQTDNYLLMRLGWSNAGRVHAIPIHVRIKDNKFWIEWDGTEYSIAQELVDAGVPKTDIILAFLPAETRELSDFAVA